MECFNGRTAACKSHFTKCNAKRWMEWCEACCHWTLEQWKHLPWRDESRFSVWRSLLCPCLFQHDCSPVHTERFIKTWLDEFDVEELDWIPQSPDLNLIEHLWDELKWKLQDRPSTSLPDLTNALLDEWAKITTKTLQNLVEIYLNLNLKYNLNLKGHMTLLCMSVLAVLQRLWKLFIQSDFTAVTVQQKINCGLLSFGRVQTHTVSYV